jgi:cytochrome c-type biogenesis protein
VTLIWAAGSAAWLGVLASICPCPLATNIAAISFLARRVQRPRAVLLSGLLYTAGQAAAYVGLGAILVAGLTASADVSLFLQKYVSRLLGPVLILAGMAILGLLGERLSISLAGLGAQERARRGGAGWAAAMGILLALSFCPGTAAIFFGGLVPLATAQQSRVLLPLAYGLGAAAPVAAVAFLAAYAAGAMGKAFNRLRQFERWARAITGAIFILVGIYYSLTYIFGVTIPAR